MSCIILSGMFNLMMIGEINRRRENEKQISYFGYTFGKQIEILKEYRRYYPGGRLHILGIGSFLLGIFLLLLFGVLQLPLVQVR